MPSQVWKPDRDPSILPPRESGAPNTGTYATSLRHSTPTDWQEAAHSWRERLLTALNCAGDAIEIRSAENVVQYVNRAWELLTGYELLDIRGTAAASLDPDIEGDDTLGQALGHVLSGEGWSGELQRRNRSGRLCVYEMVISPVMDRTSSKVTHYVAVSRDVSARKAEEKHLAHVAYHDGLTGLPNRNLLLDRVTAFLERTGQGPTNQGALLYFDFDRFKMVNDSLGHEYGDRLLEQVARRANGIVREGDLLARIGGDEFCFFIRRIGSSEEAIQAAERVLQTFAAAFDLDGPKVITSASVGIAMLPGPSPRSALEYMCDADRAMLRAKRSGGGQIVLFDDSLRAHDRKRQALEAEVVSAVRAKRFRVRYDSVTDLNTDVQLAVEGRLWLRDTDDRPLPYSASMDIAEQFGLASQLTRWLIETTLAEHGGGPATGDSFVPVDGSMQSMPGVRFRITHAQVLYESGLQMLDDALKQSQLTADRVTIVLCEVPTSCDWAALAAHFGPLEHAGAKLELDGFAGRHGIEGLEWLRLSGVLLEQDVAIDALTSDARLAVLAGLCQLAHAMQLRVGVDDPSPAGNHSRLREAGVDYVVGTYAGNPTGRRANRRSSNQSEPPPAPSPAPAPAR